MSTHVRAAIVFALTAVSVASTTAQRPVRRDLLVAAAASLSGTLEAPLARALHDATGIDVKYMFAGSNTLARQIVEGARVDVFISADVSQMDVVDRAGRLVPDSRVDVISNQLVVIAPRGEREGVTRPADLARPAVRRVAMGDPEAVPVGVYGRQWLETMGLWGDVRSKAVPLPSSPAVLAAVRGGHVEAGIVYATDARGASQTSGIRVVYPVPPDEGPPIVYPAAAIRGGREVQARRFLAFLRSSAARRVLEAGGFRVLSTP